MPFPGFIEYKSDTSNKFVQQWWEEIEQLVAFVNQLEQVNIAQEAEITALTARVTTLEAEMVVALAKP